MEEDKEVKLYGSKASPFVQKVKWALQLKQIKYVYVEEDLSNKSDSLLQYNPVYKKVPVLVHDGKPISESTVILEYIEQVWPHNPLLPRIPYERAISRFWIQFGEQKGLTFFGVMLAKTHDEQENAKKDAIEALKTLEEQGLGDKMFFNGDSIGLVDLSFGWMTYFLEAFEEAVGVKLLEPSILPCLHAWAQRFKELHGFWASPFVHRIEWALQLKQIKYDYVEEDVINNKSESLLLYNPVYKKVPVLVHRGRPISESIVILEYIEQLWPQNPLLPEDPYEKAMARFWIKFGDDNWLLYGAVMKANTPDEQETAKRDAIGMMKTIEEGALGDKSFFDGSSIGLVDLSFGWMTYFLEAFEEAVGVKLLEPSILPRLHAWAQRFKELPLVKANHPNHHDLVSHISRVRERLLANSPPPKP